MKPTLLFLLLLIAANSGILFAQNKTTTPFSPDRDQMMKRYKLAEERDTLARRTVFRSSVVPGWTSASSFWYRNALPDSLSEYIFVDPVKKLKTPLFDVRIMTEVLATATGKKVSAGSLPIKDIYVYPGGKKIALEINFVEISANPAGGNLARARQSDFYDVDLTNYRFTKIDTIPTDKTIYPGLTRTVGRWQRNRNERVSPDKKWTIVFKENNIYLQPAAGGDAIAYTTDGTKELPYGETVWSPDSRYLIAYKIKRVIDKPVYYIATSLPNVTRGEIKQQPYKQPGDDFSTYEMYVVKVADRAVTKVNTDIIDFFDAPRIRWNDGDNDHYLFEKVDRGHQRFRIIEVNAADGNTRNIVDEKTNTFIYEQKIATYYLPASSEIIWITEKDGWRHIYLVDAKNGVIKNPVTKGDWVVRSIDSVDIKKREIWFQASGMNAGEDPYNIHYYRIGFNGNNLVTLTSPGYNHRLVFSPDKQYFLDTYSTPNKPPVSIVGKISDGSKVMDVEKTDLSRFTAAKLSLPEVFHAKGRDAVTDIWGVIFRPSDFDPSKRYPIIENIYAGPQDSFVPKSFSASGEMQSIAELGFIVVQIDGMGTYNRSKAFHDVCWKNLGDAGFPDRIAWMRALAAKYPEADTSRIGLYGTSAGGQNSLGGLLFHPEWYKAAFSACGCHDNRIDKQWWNEQWMGYPLGKHYDEQSNITNAHKLKGKLLLVVGEADQNVPPESTYRVVDALIKAKKTFDFLAVPGMGHGDGGAYGRVKKRDFFVKSLLGIDPPDRNNDELGGK
jgi:dipeptidyl aminopeptidase/acylaminoacyl peptidase